MRVFFDTNVLVAASERSHPHHAQVWPALRRVAAGKDKRFMSVHSIAEVYAALTRLPVQPRIHSVVGVGSTRAELADWRVDLDRKTAQCESNRGCRQALRRLEVVRIEPIAREPADSIIAGYGIGG